MTTVQDIHQQRRWRFLSYASAGLLVVATPLWLMDGQPNSVLLPACLLCLSRAMLASTPKLRTGLLGVACGILVVAMLISVQSIIDRFSG